MKESVKSETMRFKGAMVTCLLFKNKCLVNTWVQFNDKVLLNFIFINLPVIN